MNSTVTKEEVTDFGDFYLFKCPHHNCGVAIGVKKNEINCKIFICGHLISNGEPIPPHSSKSECDRLRTHKLIYGGCGKPFIFKDTYVETRDYER